MESPKTLFTNLVHHNQICIMLFVVLNIYVKTICCLIVFRNTSKHKLCLLFVSKRDKYYLKKKKSYGVYQINYYKHTKQSYF